MKGSVVKNLSLTPTLKQSLVLHLHCTPQNVKATDLELDQNLQNCVTLYTTSLRGIRKTFEDCSTIRFLLESLGVRFSERDVSMDMELREELWRVMGGGRVIPPRLFIKGRYIGGADEVVTLHEQGRLRGLFEGLPLKGSRGPCKGCGGLGFVVCVHCSGSCKVVGEEESHGLRSSINSRCHECNENGLVKCPICE